MYNWLLALLAAWFLLSPKPEVATQPSQPTIHAAAPVVKPTVKPTSKPILTPQLCKTAPAGWVAWYPGQVAPYVLFASTGSTEIPAGEYYSAPAGYVVLIKRWTNPDGSISAITNMVSLSQWCN